MKRKPPKGRGKMFGKDFNQKDVASYQWDRTKTNIKV